MQKRKRKYGNPQTTGFSVSWFSSNPERTFYLSFSVSLDYRWDYVINSDYALGGRADNRP